MASKAYAKRTAIIAKRLKEIRLEQGASQQEIAEYAGIDRKTVNRIENGHFSPNMETFLRICDSLGTTPSLIIQGV
jgi:transcriptional regulator with XRE-family HTH domain